MTDGDGSNRIVLSGFMCFISRAKDSRWIFQGSVFPFVTVSFLVTRRWDHRYRYLRFKTMALLRQKLQTNNISDLIDNSYKSLFVNFCCTYKWCMIPTA